MKHALGKLMAAAALAVYSPIYLSAGDVRALGSPLVAAKKQAVSFIPAGVPVAASNQLAGHLSARRLIVMRGTSNEIRVLLQPYCRIATAAASPAPASGTCVPAPSADCR